MRQFAIELLTIARHPLVLVGVVCLLWWLYSKSPALRWIGKVALLVVWGVMTVGMIVFVVFAIYIPRGEYVGALFAVLAGSVICFLWVALGAPELLKTLKIAKNGIKLWEGV
jgi:hypothetical protein